MKFNSASHSHFLFLFFQKGLKNVFDEAIVAALQPPTREKEKALSSSLKSFFKSIFFSLFCFN